MAVLLFGIARNLYYKILIRFSVGMNDILSIWICLLLYPSLNCLYEVYTHTDDNIGLWFERKFGVNLLFIFINTALYKDMS